MPSGCVDVVVLVLELLLGLVHLGGGGGHLLEDLLEGGLELLHLLAGVPDLDVELVADGVALADVLLIFGVLCIQSIDVELKMSFFLVLHINFCGFC